MLKNNNYKLIVGIIIGFVISSSIVYAVGNYVMSSSDVGYDNSNIELVSDNVQGALDELYQSCGSSSGCPDGYVCYEKINVLSLFEDNAVRDDISSTYVTSSSGINFGAISSDTNGKGIYLRSNTELTGNPIYYYRGAVTNNNVIFANYCWKIVRTTETGGIKLLYNGGTSDGHCMTTTGTGAGITQMIFTSVGMTPSALQMGYMYGTNNGTPSSIKTYIENWFGTNIENKNSSTGNKYSSYLEDAVWCNDRDGTDSNPGPHQRLYNQRTPDLGCTRTIDSFTISSSNGNGNLTYPVGLLTADEMSLAGGSYGIANNTFYLYTGQITWSMSPFTYNGSGAPYMFSIAGTGELWYTQTSYNAPIVRPAISLKPGTTFMEGGDGTSTNPYVVVE